MHFEKKMSYAKIAEATGKSPARVGQLVREGWRLVEQGRLQIKDGKKSEIKSNILKVSLLRKIITAEGDTQTIVTTDKKPTAIITADTQEYNTTTNVMTATGNAIINYVYV